MLTTNIVSANRKLLSKPRGIRNFIVDFSNTLSLSTIVLILIHLHDDRNTRPNNTVAVIKIILYHYLLLSLYGWYQIRRDFNAKVNDVTTEKKRTLNILSSRCFPKWSSIGLMKRVTTDINNPYLVIFLAKEDIQISWEIGTEALFEAATKLNEIFSLIKKTLEKNDYPPGMPSTPNALKTWVKFKPHTTHKIDFPSKLRWFHYFTFPAYLASRPLKNMLGNAMPLSDENFYFIYAAVMLAATIGESYILNMDKMKISLEGFTNLYEHYCACPPTCIGQQVTKKLALYPPNKDFNNLSQYLLNGIEYLEKLSSNTIINDGSLKKKIKEFHRKNIGIETIPYRYHEKAAVKLIKRYSFFNNSTKVQKNDSNLKQIKIM